MTLKLMSAYLLLVKMVEHAKMKSIVSDAIAHAVSMVTCVLLMLMNARICHVLMEAPVLMESIGKLNFQL